MNDYLPFEALLNNPMRVPGQASRYLPGCE